MLHTTSNECCSDLTIDKVTTAVWGQHAVVAAHYALVHAAGQSDVVLRKQNREIIVTHYSLYHNICLPLAPQYICILLWTQS